MDDLLPLVQRATQVKYSIGLDTIFVSLRTHLSVLDCMLVIPCQVLLCLPRSRISFKACEPEVAGDDGAWQSMEDALAL
jgi:hypothetical protein